MNGIDISQFNRLKKQSSDSFHQQKKRMAKVMKGEKVSCEICKQNITMIPASNTTPLQLRCKKGCTDIELDLV